MSIFCVHSWSCCWTTRACCSFPHQVWSASSWSNGPTHTWWATNSAWSAATLLGCSYPPTKRPAPQTAVPNEKSLSRWTEPEDHLAGQIEFPSSQWSREAPQCVEETHHKLQCQLSVLCFLDFTLPSMNPLIALRAIQCWWSVRPSICSAMILCTGADLVWASWSGVGFDR